MNYELLKEIAKTNLCAACGYGFNVCWKDGKYQLRCECGYQEEPGWLERIRGSYELVRSGEPCEFSQGIRRKIRQDWEMRLEKSERSMADRTDTLPAITGKDKQLADVTRRFGSALYGREKDQELVKLVTLVNIGFDPRMNHLCIYQGKVWIKDAGWSWWKSQRDPEGRYGITHRVVKAVDKADYGLTDDEIGVISEIRDLKNNNQVVGEGFGKASTRSYTYVAPDENATDAVKKAALEHPDRLRNPIDATNPFSMAQKRAEVQAKKDAFPLPGGMDIPAMADEDSVLVIMDGTSTTIRGGTETAATEVQRLLKESIKHLIEIGYAETEAGALKVIDTLAAADPYKRRNWYALTLDQKRQIVGEIKQFKSRTAPPPTEEPTEQ